MGSSLHLHWVLVASVCGVFYLIFDALRSFALQLSPVRLRRLSTDAEEGMSRFRNFEVEDFQLVGGALLQVALVIGVGAGSTVWWLVLTQGVGMFRHHFFGGGQTTRWPNFIAGTLIIVFGLYALTAVFRLF